MTAKRAMRPKSAICTAIAIIPLVGAVMFGCLCSHFARTQDPGLAFIMGLLALCTAACSVCALCKGEEMICEKCWADAYLRALSSGKSQHEEYVALLEERKGAPCSPEQQGKSVPVGREEDNHEGGWRSGVSGSG